MALLEGKVAIITGAAAGIGEATAHFFAKEGARVIAVDRDADGVAAVAAAIGDSALGVAADVRDRAALAASVDAALQRFGRIDALINNAGIYPRQDLLTMTEAQWDEMQDVNLKSIFHLTQLVAPQMIKQNAGKIVNISSVTFFLGYARLGHYVAAKGGVIGLTRVSARELGVYNIHVNCITPGAIETESEKRFVTPEQAKAFLEPQSLKRRLQPVDIAKVCAFLSSSLSDGMTGQTVNVDAGWVLH